MNDTNQPEAELHMTLSGDVILSDGAGWIRSDRFEWTGDWR